MKMMALYIFCEHNPSYIPIKIKKVGVKNSIKLNNKLFEICTFQIKIVFY